MTEKTANSFRRWFEYEKDAHRKTLESIRGVPSQLHDTDDFKKAVDLFAHILAARLMWLYRFGISNESAELFPKPTDLSALPLLLETMEASWSTYLSQLTDAELARIFEYRSYDGSRFRNSIEDILTQLFGHSWYHRGQIAQLIRRLGAEPAVTDFVFWTREPVKEID
jgi:uncharacterized damage-inducible protein DinB